MRVNFGARISFQRRTNSPSYPGSAVAVTELSDAPSLGRAVKTGGPAFEALLSDTPGIE